MMCEEGRETAWKKGQEEEGKSIIERWLLQARTPASQDQTWRPQRERPAGTASGGGCQGLASGGSSEGSLQHSRPCPALAASTLTSWQLSLSLSSCNATLYLFIIWKTNLDKKILPSKVCFWGMELYLLTDRAGKFSYSISHKNKYADTENYVSESVSL